MWNVGCCESHSLCEAVSAAGGQQKGDNTWTCGVRAAQWWAAWPGLAWCAPKPGYPCEDVGHEIQNTTGLFY